MRRVVVVKAKTPPDVFKSGKKVLVKKLPATAQPKPRLLEKAAGAGQNEDTSNQATESIKRLARERRVSHGLFDSDSEDSYRRYRRRRRRRHHGSSDSSEWEASDNSADFNWDSRRCAEIIAKHRGVNRYVEALRAEINALQERLTHYEGSVPGKAGKDSGNKRLLYYQQQNRSLCRRLRRSVRQCVRMQMRLAKHGVSPDESVLEAIPYNEVPDTLAGGSGFRCRCTKAICTLVEVLEELVPAHESTIWEERLNAVTNQRDKLFNELLAAKDRLTEIQLIVESDPFLLARLKSMSIGLDLNCALSTEEQRLIMLRKIQGLEMLNGELENQLVVERNINQQWRPELRRLGAAIAQSFGQIVDTAAPDCNFSEKLSGVVVKLGSANLDAAGGVRSEELQLRVQKDAKRIQHYIDRIGELERQVVFLSNPSQYNPTVSKVRVVPKERPAEPAKKPDVAAIEPKRPRSKHGWNARDFMQSMLLAQAKAPHFSSGSR